MTQRRFGIGATVAAVTLAAAFVAAQGTAQSATALGQAGDPPVVQGQAPPAQGQMGPGRGRGPGQGLGPGQQLGPGAGRGGQMQGQRRGAGPAGSAVRRGAGGGLAALDLTDEQRVTITNLQRTTRDQAAPLQDELVFTRKALHRALFADERDDATVANLAAKASALEKQLADLHLKQATAMADVLTAEQRETMRLRQGRGRGAGRGPGNGNPVSR